MDTTNYCPLCEHYARAVEKLNDENRALRQRVAKVMGNVECMGGHDGLGCGPECSAKEG